MVASTVVTLNINEPVSGSGAGKVGIVEGASMNVLPSRLTKSGYQFGSQVGFRLHQDCVRTIGPAYGVDESVCAIHNWRINNPASCRTIAHRNRRTGQR